MLVEIWGFHIVHVSSHGIFTAVCLVSEMIRILLHLFDILVCLEVLLILELLSSVYSHSISV